jgi:hypothetical protein
MTQEETSAPDDAMSGFGASAASALREKFIDILIPGYEAEFGPDEAEQAGAFVDDALSAEDAAESSLDALDRSAPVSGTTEGA